MNISLLVDSFGKDSDFFVSKMIFDLVKSRKNELKDSGYTKFENCLAFIEISYELSAYADKRTVEGQIQAFINDDSLQSEEFHSWNSYERFRAHQFCEGKDLIH